MTSTSTPTKFVGNYESSTNHYDPDFTAEISTKMRVPDKISVIPGVELRESKIEKSQFNGDNLQQVKEKLNYMHVPDRILVVGGNKHIAGREPYLKEKGGEDSYNFDDDIELQTPPNVLTLNDINSQENGHVKGFNESILYPNEEDISRNDLLNYNSFYNSSQNLGNQNSADDTQQIIRKQIKQLNRRVNVLEMENRNRYHREILFYALGLIYLTAKGLNWFQRKW